METKRQHTVTSVYSVVTTSTNLIDSANIDDKPVDDDDEDDDGNGDDGDDGDDANGDKDDGEIMTMGCKARDSAQSTKVKPQAVMTRDNLVTIIRLAAAPISSLIFTCCHCLRVACRVHTGVHTQTDHIEIDMNDVDMDMNMNMTSQLSTLDGANHK